MCLKSRRKLTNTIYYSIANKLTIVNYRVKTTQMLFC